MKAPVALRSLRLIPVVQDGGLVVSRDAALVALSDLVDVEAVRALLRRVQPRLEEGEPPPHALDGGFLLTSGGVEIYGPRCCSDLWNLSSWQQAAEVRDDCWEMVYCGHPCVVACWRNGLVWLNGYVEPGNSPLLPNPQTTVYAVQPEDLARAVTEAERVIVSKLPLFREAVTPWCEDADERARQLLGLPSE